ncbi:MAG: endo-1,4-beta-xylanase [Lacunisphaera sp.]|nr:endo-1,4-beta-xylanase [Lacunisphaera sp.]
MPIRFMSLVFLAAVSVGVVAADPVKRVALVFDDGPKPADAGPLLELLAREKVAVTFALVGDRVKESPETARAIAAAGHEIANHSQAHAHPQDLDDTALDREVAAAQQGLMAATGRAPRWYWPPFLEVDDRVRAAVPRARLALYAPRHLVVSKDYDNSVPAAEIFRLATTDVRDGSVILFHEWRKETREQLPAILAELRRQGCVFLTFSGLHGSLAASDAAAAPVIPPGGDPLLARDSAGSFEATGGQGNGDAIRLTLIDTEGPGFTRAMHIETSRDLSPAWAVEVRTPLNRAVQKGEIGLVRFFARTLASADETGAGQVRVAVQQAGPDYAKSLESTVSMRGAWQEFLLPFVFADNYAAGGVELTFGFGFKREIVELGGVELLHYGRRVELAALPRTRFTYAGREPDAAWRRAALARIDQIRKSAFLIEVRDTAGQPAAGATIRVEQRKSAFQFGSALQFARLVQDSPENQIYREKALQLFNAASPENELKWPAWDGEWGDRFDRSQSLTALRWLREQGFHVRGHVLVWPGWKNLPKSIGALKDGKKNQAKIPPLVLRHIADITGATREFVQEWDVLNEPYDNHDLMALFGTDIMVDWFKAARAGAPDAPLYLNDYSNHDLVDDKAHCLDFFKVAKFLQSKGAPLGGLGLQGHISAQPTPPERVLAALEVYAEFKLPIRFTEFDVDTTDEQLQADYTRDFLILAYSHPSVVGVQHWGFWEKAHWRPAAALFRADWSPKPAAQVYEDLVLRQWRTKLKGRVGSSGQAEGRGFHGDYVVTVERDGKRTEQTFTLRSDESKTVVTVTLP